MAKSFKIVRSSWKVLEQKGGITTSSPFDSYRDETPIEVGSIEEAIQYQHEFAERALAANPDWPGAQAFVRIPRGQRKPNGWDAKTGKRVVKMRQSATV